MLRIPGSINSKNKAEVKVIQWWDGNRPSIAHIRVLILLSIVYLESNMNAKMLLCNTTTP